MSAGRWQGAQSVCVEQKGGQLPLHTPLRQVSPAVQAFPQRPQLLLSVMRLMPQTSPLLVPEQTHDPLTRVCPARQALSQHLQLPLSAFRLRQTSSPAGLRHQLSPGEQTHWPMPQARRCTVESSEVLSPRRHLAYELASTATLLRDRTECRKREHQAHSGAARTQDVDE